MVTSAGPLTNAIAGVMALLANAAYFQTWTGTANATDAAKHIFAMETGYPIASISIAAGVLTVNTRETHTLSAGQTVTLTGASIGAESGQNIAGVYTITAVTGSSFTAPTAAADASETYADFAFVLPCQRPIAVVCLPGDGALGGDHDSTGPGALFSGKLEILLEADTSGQYANDAINATAEAQNAVGKLLQSLAATNDTGAATFTDGDGNDLEFVANDFHLVTSPQFTARDGQDNGARFERWVALIAIGWGVR